MLGEVMHKFRTFIFKFGSLPNTWQSLVLLLRPLSPSLLVP